MVNPKNNVKNLYSYTSILDQYCDSQETMDQMFYVRLIDVEVKT